MRNRIKDEILCENMDEIAEVLNYNIDILEKRIKKIDSGSKKRAACGFIFATAIAYCSIIYTNYQNLKIIKILEERIGE